MLTSTVSFAPTANWSVLWSTAFDIEQGRFNDHSVSFERDLHEWQASFSFLQSTTGNWAFNFIVSLRANPDLHFDYDQRSQGP
jgi:hypothetical protein